MKITILERLKITGFTFLKPTTRRGYWEISLYSCYPKPTRGCRHHPLGPADKVQARAPVPGVAALAEVAALLVLAQAASRAPRHLEEALPHDLRSGDRLVVLCTPMVG